MAVSIPTGKVKDNGTDEPGTGEVEANLGLSELNAYAATAGAIWIFEDSTA